MAVDEDLERAIRRFHADYINYLIRGFTSPFTKTSCFRDYLIYYKVNRIDRSFTITPHRKAMAGEIYEAAKELGIEIDK